MLRGMKKAIARKMAKFPPVSPHPPQLQGKISISREGLHSKAS